MRCPPSLSDESKPSSASFLWVSFLNRWKSGMNPVVRHFAVFTLMPDHLLNASFFEHSACIASRESVTRVASSAYHLLDNVWPESENL